MEIGTYMPIIALNVNGINAPTKRHRLAEWIQRQDPYICCLQEIPFRPHSTYTKNEKKVYSAFGWTVLKISMKSILSNVSFKTCVSLLIFCFVCCLDEVSCRGCRCCLGDASSLFKWFPLYEFSLFDVP